MKPILILYVPVIHKGYIDLLGKYKNIVDTIYLIGDDIVTKISPYKEIRCIHASTVWDFLNHTVTIPLFSSIEIFSVESDPRTFSGKEVITLSNEVCSAFAAQYLGAARSVTFDSDFLQWDGSLVYSRSNVHYDRVSTDAYDQAIMDTAIHESKKSSDWWRRVGAVVIHSSFPKETTFLKTHNTHVPHEYTPYMNGDPRDFVEAGKDSHLTSALHAEQAIIAAAARHGISLEGLSLYITTFPCPVCAKLIAASGIKKLFYATGHASLDGETVLRSAGIEIILVQ